MNSQRFNQTDSLRSIKWQIVLPEPRSFPCHNFAPPDSPERTVTAVVAAIRIWEASRGEVRLRYSCNMGRACRCVWCVYASRGDVCSLSFPEEQGTDEDENNL